MKILFLTLYDFRSYDEHNIYCDLLREFIKNGHDVYSISPTERRHKINTHFLEEGHLLKLKTGNIQKTVGIKKGLSTLLIEPQLIIAIKTYFRKIKFDLLIYSTPPITLFGAIKYLKKRDNARTYLLLKDIFPQNAVDLRMMQTNGMKSLIYLYFRNKEKKLYKLSDRIGCMSKANLDYVIDKNPEISSDKVEICPNAIEPQDFRLSKDEIIAIRDKYEIPQDKIVFVYGGNLGKPQGIPFIIDCLRAEQNNKKVFFLVVGDGTDYDKLFSYINEEKPANVKLMRRLTSNEYDRMIAACDIGMIFLDKCFTIPNFPSRLLSYMQAGLPVLACTDRCTDIGEFITHKGFGWSCHSDNICDFLNVIRDIQSTSDSNLSKMTKNEFTVLREEFDVKKIYRKIVTEKLL